MHEFSICNSIINIVKNKIENFSNQVVINLLIGELVIIDIDSLKFWFPIVAKENKLNIKLNIIHKPGKALCAKCNNTFQIHNFLENCPNCSSFKKSVLEGNELIIQNMEVN